MTSFGEQKATLEKHYYDVIMGTMASQITSLTIVYSTVHSGADQRKHQSSTSLAFVWGIHRWPVNSPYRWPVTRKFFHLMTSSCNDSQWNLEENMSNIIDNIVPADGLAPTAAATSADIMSTKSALRESFMGPKWGPSGADRTQMGPMLAPWTLLSGWVPYTNGTGTWRVNWFREMRFKLL